MALQLADDYKSIAEKIKAKYPVNFDYIEIDKILFLTEDEKTPKKYAECRKVIAPYNFITDYRFIITFYANNMINLSESQQHMVVFHELCHIDSDFTKLKKHDFEDFKDVIMKAGNNPFWTIDPNCPDILEDNASPSINAAALQQNEEDEDEDAEPEMI